MSPKRIQRKRTAGWKMPSNAVYVGRPTKWGNPYTPDNYTFINPETFTGRPATFAECVEMYRVEITCTDGCHPSEHGWTEGLDPRELAGKDLACWCPLGSPCHADVLLALANGGAP